MAIKKTQYIQRNTQYLKGKKILITAGPTWVPIDRVRVISNIASGETGILLALGLQRLGAKVTLLLGPAKARCLNKKIKLISFKLFDELKKIVIAELKSKTYDIVIHSAAVSDYRPQKIYSQKVKAGIKNWRLNLVPTEKIIDLIKKIDRSIFLVGFKFEPEVGKYKLIESAKKLMIHSNLDLAVANTVKKNRYLAYIIEQNRICGPFSNKHDLAEMLINKL